jgi:predicted peroxiredoxin
MGAEVGMARILYLTATGPSDPTRASLAFHLAANGAAEAGHEADVVLAGDAAELVKAGAAEAVRGVGIPPLIELLEKVRQKGVRVHV